MAQTKFRPLDTEDCQENGSGPFSVVTAPETTAVTTENGIEPKTRHTPHTVINHVRHTCQRVNGLRELIDWAHRASGDESVR